MSTLKVNTVQHNTSGFNNVVQFTDGGGTQNGTLCRVWVNFDGTFGTSPFTIANGGIRAAFNVSSITDNGTGDYTVNFSSALADANYCASVNRDGNQGLGHAANVIRTSTQDTTRNVSYVRVYSGYTYSSGYSLEDAPVVAVSIFR